jgi:hypothetical protein
VTTPLPPEDVEAARRELRALLDEVREAMGPPSPAAQAEFHEVARQLRDSGMLPELLQRVPPAFVRLCALLGLSDRERAFVVAALDDAADSDTLSVLADYLEEQGRTRDGARLRRLSPKDGDVLAWTVPDGGDQSPRDAACAAALRLQTSLRDAHGVQTLWVVLPADGGLEVLPPDALRAAGWVRADRLARDLEAMAALEDCDSMTRTRLRVLAADARGGRLP